MQVKNRPATATGGGDYRLAEIPATGRRTAMIADHADVLYRETGDLHGTVRDTRRRANLADLESRRTQIALGSLTEMLEELSDKGFAWRDIARVLDVSVPAVTKWRRGSGATGENRLRVAKLLALIEMLESRFVTEVASWLEMRVSEGVAVTPLDMLAAGRYDLVLDLAAEHSNGEGSEHTLTEYAPDWRDRFIDNAFETFLGHDGVVSIRPKGTAE
nr:transcriptional regulator [Prescottella equi]